MKKIIINLHKNENGTFKSVLIVGNQEGNQEDLLFRSYDQHTEAKAIEVALNAALVRTQDIINMCQIT